MVAIELLGDLFLRISHLPQVHDCVHRQTVNSEADPLNPTLNDVVDEFIRKAGNWLLVPEIADKNGTLRVEVGPLQPHYISLVSQSFTSRFFYAFVFVFSMSLQLPIN